MRLFVATHNAHKIREIAQILPDFEIVADDPVGIEENAPDFAGNARLKVRAIAARHAGEWCMADDSGLEVKALGGEPGVRSARYAGEPSNTANNNALLLKNLTGVTERTANFACAIALVDPRGRERVVMGRCFGHIAETARGTAGFGYDPLFIPDGYDRSFADLTAEEKNAISHRGRALAKVRRLIDGETCGSPWLRFFRVVNLPTVPGDVLVGAAAVMAAWGARMTGELLGALVAAGAAAIGLYLFGLADNDIVGAATDADRPIPNGEISLGAARVARAICWAGAVAAGVAGGLPPLWWVAAFALLVGILAYNRTKDWLLMGVCRGLNVICGAGAVAGAVARANPRGWPAVISVLADGETLLYVGSVALLWTLYIAGVTKYSAGEEADPGKRATVGFLIGALVYLQLVVLVVLALQAPETRTLLIAGAVLLVILRGMKMAFPKVRAS
ncbi:MAG: RdgB/HAM1 family non-canonical purine NTP pyrophosphatase [Kiritimatiellia bacterium]